MKRNYYVRDIDADLWRKVKTRAASEGKSLRDVILECLKHYARNGLNGKK